MRIARLICSLLLAVGSLAIPAQSRAQVAVGISVQFGPPALPVYEQPLCPGDGYIWTPGYWAWDPGDEDYYWASRGSRLQELRPRSQVPSNSRRHLDPGFLSLGSRGRGVLL